MGRPRHTSLAEQNVWMEQRIVELEAERDAAYNKGMERAAEIMLAIGYCEDDVELDHIRREIEK